MVFTNPSFLVNNFTPPQLQIKSQYNNIYNNFNLNQVVIKSKLLILSTLININFNFVTTTDQHNSKIFNLINPIKQRLLNNNSYFNIKPTQLRRTITQNNDNMTTVNKTEEEWRMILTPEQFRVLRQKGTEMPGTGEYNKYKENGVYNCAACGTALYQSNTKFDSGCGWPAFFEAIPGALKINEDRTHGMLRTEILCAKCGGHLGHVFKGEGFKTPTDERHCVNSVSLKFQPKS